MRPFLLVAAASAVGIAAGSVHAADPAIVEAMVPRGIVNLSASASIDVPRDRMTIVFSTTREGNDAAAVQAQLKQALDAALGEARKVAKPGLVDVQAGNFALYPKYPPKGGASNGWQGTAELSVDGSDLPAIGLLVGRITTLTVARVGYGLSREAREKAEADVSGQAIARYRAMAAGYASQFGYAGYSIREVHVAGGEAPPNRPLPLQGRAMTAASEEALPVEAGRTVVTVTVSGSVQMK